VLNLLLDAQLTDNFNTKAIQAIFTADQFCVEGEQCVQSGCITCTPLLCKPTQYYAVLYACACIVLRIKMLQDLKELLSYPDIS